MSGYSILILICSTALSHADCQVKTAAPRFLFPERGRFYLCLAARIKPK